jgi:hypothetical protein
MTRIQHSYWIGLCLAAIAGLFVARGEPQHKAFAAAAPAGWEYQTASVELGSLGTKLTEFGRDGWEVFSIAHSDAIVDTGADGKPHVTYVRVEVTAKRPKTP